MLVSIAKIIVSCAALANAAAISPDIIGPFGLKNGHLNMTLYNQHYFANKTINETTAVYRNESHFLATLHNKTINEPAKTPKEMARLMVENIWRQPYDSSNKDMFHDFVVMLAEIVADRARMPWLKDDKAE